MKKWNIGRIDKNGKVWMLVISGEETMGFIAMEDEPTPIDMDTNMAIELINRYGLKNKTLFMMPSVNMRLTENAEENTLGLGIF